MIIYPAIDIRNGNCVRLVEGDFNRETIFGADPAEMAKQFERQGAEWIHVVDLDGAREGHPVNHDAIFKMRSALSIPMQIGGGIRSTADVRKYLDAGVDRLVIGTAAYQNADFMQTLAKSAPDAIAIGIDARGGNVAGSGWLDQTDICASELAEKLSVNGFHTFIYTDIKRDGTLTGPNLEELATMHQTLGHGLIASGGISSLQDIERVAAVGVDGVIIGRALYDGRFSLPEALETASAVTGTRL